MTDSNNGDIRNSEFENSVFAICNKYGLDITNIKIQSDIMLGGRAGENIFKRPLNESHCDDEQQEDEED
jgi:hypothetical protein